MTNETDLNKCSAQIELVRQLIDQPETFDLDKVLVTLETKKKLLMTFKPRDYITILKGIESGVLIHPGVWIKEIEPLPSTHVIADTVDTPESLKTHMEIENEKAKDLEIKRLKELLALKEARKELAKEDPEIILE